MNISVHICFTLATGCAYALYIYKYIWIYVCVDVYVCMYIYLYVCVPLHVYAYVHGCIYMCMCMCMCMCMYMYMYVYMYIYISLYHVYVQFVSFSIGNEDGWVQLVYESACCLAWGAIFDRRNDSAVVCVLSIFNAGGSAVCV